jgi:hypothetical protein
LFGNEIDGNVYIRHLDIELFSIKHSSCDTACRGAANACGY